MERGQRGLLDALATAPWPAGLAAGLVAFFLIRDGIPAWLSGHPSPLAQAFVEGLAFAVPAWIALSLCWSAALASWLRARRRRRLLDTRSGLDSVRALGWRDFERLVGEAYRRQGYRVEETGLGGADGGVDLVLARGGRRILVQCKRWDRERVPVNVVREMYGLLAHHRADEVRIAALGDFTRDARRFARGKPIVLVDGHALLALVREAQQVPPPPSQPAPQVPPLTAAPERASRPGLDPRVADGPACPRCRQPMVERENRWTKETFWGCVAYPRCRGTR